MTTACAPLVRAGDMIRCPTCKREHELVTIPGEAKNLLFYRCQGHFHKGAISGWVPLQGGGP